MFDCVHQALCSSGSKTFHTGQEAYSQLVCAWTQRAAAHSLMCGGRGEPEWLNNLDQQKRLKLPAICGIQFQITELFDVLFKTNA